MDARALGSGSALMAGTNIQSIARQDFGSGLSLQNQQTIRLYEAGTGGASYASISAPANISGTYSYVLPDSQSAAGQTLLNDGSGNNTWDNLDTDNLLGDGRVSFGAMPGSGSGTGWQALYTASGLNGGGIECLPPCS